MSFAAIRAPLRRQAWSASFKRPQLRTSSFRKYSTEAPPAAKSNTGLYVGLGAVVLGGGVAYYLYDSSSETAKVTSSALKSAAQSAKVATNFVPTKEDYQKVCSNLSVDASWSLSFVFQVYNRIAEVIDDADDYDSTVFKRLVWFMFSYCFRRWLFRPCSCPSGMACLWHIRQGYWHWRKVSSSCRPIRSRLIIDVIIQ